MSSSTTPVAPLFAFPGSSSHPQHKEHILDDMFEMFFDGGEFDDFPADGNFFPNDDYGDENENGEDDDEKYPTRSGGAPDKNERRSDALPLRP
jgi:hypothetical protein